MDDNMGSSATIHPATQANTTAGERFTPGPWEADDLDSAGQRIVKGEHIEICTCWHHCVGSIEKEMEANARLISAAPDMHGALDYAKRNGIDKTFWQMALAALAKAGGQ